MKRLNAIRELEVGTEEVTDFEAAAADIVEEAFSVEPGVNPAPARMPEPGAELLFEG